MCDKEKNENMLQKDIDWELIIQKLINTGKLKPDYSDGNFLTNFQEIIHGGYDDFSGMPVIPWKLVRKRKDDKSTI